MAQTEGGTERRRANETLECSANTANMQTAQILEQRKQMRRQNEAERQLLKKVVICLLCIMVVPAQCRRAQLQHDP